MNTKLFLDQHDYGFAYPQIIWQPHLFRVTLNNNFNDTHSLPWQQFSATSRSAAFTLLKLFHTTFTISFHPFTNCFFRYIKQFSNFLLFSTGQNSLDCFIAQSLLCGTTKRTGIFFSFSTHARIIYDFTEKAKKKLNYFMLWLVTAS